MKKLTCMASISRPALVITASLIFLSGILTIADGAEFFCQSGNVTCLIAAINEANATPGKNTINLEPGVYTLQVVNNTTGGSNGLPAIAGSILIQASAADPATVIERDPNATSFRIFFISQGGELTLDGLIIQKGRLSIGGPALWNNGTTSLKNSIVTNSTGEVGTIVNEATLNVYRSIISDNIDTTGTGGIFNFGGTVLVENSTIARNIADGAGGISNLNAGSLIVRNSSIILNQTTRPQGGGGILNGGSAEVVNSTIAGNTAGDPGGGGLLNFGQVSVTNSTIRDNSVNSVGVGGGIQNQSGTVVLNNTIVAGNIGNPSTGAGPDCAGTITSLGNNIVGDRSDCSINLQPTDLIGDPGLGAFTDDGTPGDGHFPLLQGSPAIDAGNNEVCLSNPVLHTDQIGDPRVGVCDIGAIEFSSALTVALDVKHISSENPINPRSNGVISVAILSTSNFQASTIDQPSLRFGPNQASVDGSGQLVDVNGDGLLDLVLHFGTQASGIQCGEISVSITGQTVNGIPVQGSDSITTVGCKSASAQP